MFVFVFLLQGAADSPILGPWASLGVGGALAGLMFYFYRLDRKDAHKRLDEHTTRYEKMADHVANVVNSNTAAQTELRGSIDGLKDSINTRRRKGEEAER